MTASRSQFAKLAALTAVIGFTVGGILSPPDPFSQLRMTGLVIGLGFVAGDRTRIRRLLLAGL